MRPDNAAKILREKQIIFFWISSVLRYLSEEFFKKIIHFSKAVSFTTALAKNKSIKTDAYKILQKEMCAKHNADVAIPTQLIQIYN